MRNKPATTKETDDLELERRITNYLWGRHVPGLRRLEVSAKGGIVTLSGRVATFYEKQLGNHCCRRVAGVLRLVDAVDVVEPPSSTQAVA